jgi:hypothetical protein
VSGKSAGHPPVSPGPREVDRRLLDTLAAHDGPAGICPAVPRLAGLLGVSESSVHRALRRLVSGGLVERIQVFERDDDLEWKRRGRRTSHARRQTSNTYRLTPGSQGKVDIDTPPGVSPFRETAAQTPVSGVAVDTPVVKESEASTVSRGGGAADTSVSLVSPEPVEISIEPPASALLARSPSKTAILATLAGAFGKDEVEVLSVSPNDGAATDYTTARGRVIDLAGGKRPESKQAVADLHQAVEELDRHTCRWLNGGSERCTRDRPCGRHTRRRRPER